MFFDRLTLDKPRKTSEGFLVVRAKACRTGVYQYTGAEVDPDNKHGLRDQDCVNVLRDDATVFDKKAVHSFIGKPVTDDHPNEAVNADNWRDHARGVIMGALKDGEHLAFDLLLTDADAIKAVDGGKRELSNGYAAELEFGDFEAADGTKCPVRQASIRGNHIAIVDRGRAGADCRIADAARCVSLPADAFELLLDERTYNPDPNGNKNASARRETSGSHVGDARQDGEVKMHTLIIDGLQVTEVSDQAKAAIEKLQGQLRDADTAKSAAEKALTDEQAKVVERDATITTKDAKITELEAKLTDAALTPAKLKDAAKEYAAVCDKAKALGVEFAEDADTDAIMKAVVDAKMGDVAKDYSADHIAIAFDALTKDAKVEAGDPLRDTLRNGIKPTAAGRAGVENARKAWLADKAGAYHRQPAAQGAK